MHLFVQQITVKCKPPLQVGYSKKITRVVYYPNTQRVPGYPRQPYTWAFNEFLYESLRIFLISENSLKFAIFLLR